MTVGALHSIEAQLTKNLNKLDETKIKSADMFKKGSSKMEVIRKKSSNRTGARQWSA